MLDLKKRLSKRKLERTEEYKEALKESPRKYNLKEDKPIHNLKELGKFFKKKKVKPYK